MDHGMMLFFRSKSSISFTDCGTSFLLRVTESGVEGEVKKSIAEDKHRTVRG